MAMQHALPLDAHKPQHNQLLAALPADSFTRLRPHLQFMRIPLGKVLHEPGAKMHQAYFPTDSIISLISVMIDGFSSEISVVGNEGLIGMPLIMGGGSTSSRAVVQRAGGAYSLPRRVLLDEFERHDKMMEVLLHYTQALITQIAQNAVCNRYHSIDQQLCRWLLMSLDRLPGNCLLVTQELIANMLGVRREGVCEAAGKLQKLGAITYKRGKLEVLDRSMLESLCCECYTVVRKETERLLTYPFVSETATNRRSRIALKH